MGSDVTVNINDILANERTFLAWIRTGLTVFTLGIAIARFSGSSGSSKLTDKTSDKRPIISGFILVLCGIALMIYSVWRYYRTHEQMKTKCIPRLRGPCIVLCILLVALVTVLILIFFV